MRLPGVNAHLAEGWRQLRRAYELIPADARPPLDTELWREAEAKVDRACLADNAHAAHAAIDAWVARGLEQFEDAREAAA